MKVTFSDIKWDTDDLTPEECGLPASCMLEVEEGTDLAEEGADILSDEYGVCVKSFDFAVQKCEYCGQHCFADGGQGCDEAQAGGFPD